jgi:hypothetical protein
MLFPQLNYFYQNEGGVDFNTNWPGCPAIPKGKKLWTDLIGFQNL